MSNDIELLRSQKKTLEYDNKQLKNDNKKLNDIILRLQNSIKFLESKIQKLREKNYDKYKRMRVYKEIIIKHFDDDIDTDEDRKFLNNNTVDYYKNTYIKTYGNKDGYIKSDGAKCLDTCKGWNGNSVYCDCGMTEKGWSLSKYDVIPINYVSEFDF
jgi:hypothetical protein